MAKLIAMKCPSCGADITKPDNQLFCFCSHCGTKVFFDDETININYHYYDEAKLEELRIQEEQRKKEEDERNARIAYEKDIWDQWFALVKKFYIYAVAAVFLTAIVAALIYSVFNIFYLFIIPSGIAALVFMFSPIYLISKRPKRTTYVPDKLLGKHSSITTLLILYGLMLIIWGLLSIFSEGCSS